jgi:hypothetical protein
MTKAAVVDKGKKRILEGEEEGVTKKKRWAVYPGWLYVTYRN